MSVIINFETRAVLNFILFNNMFWLIIVLAIIYKGMCTNGFEIAKAKMKAKNVKKKKEAEIAKIFDN